MLLSKKEKSTPEHEKILTLCKIGLGAVSMVGEESCMGPILCRSRTGECCSLEFIEGSVICPISCNVNRQSEVKVGTSLSSIFGVTLVTTLMYNVLTSIGATMITTTTASSTNFTSSML